MFVQRPFNKLVSFKIVYEQYLQFLLGHFITITLITIYHNCFLRKTFFKCYILLPHSEIGTCAQSQCKKTGGCDALYQDLVCDRGNEKRQNDDGTIICAGTSPLAIFAF